MRVFLRVYFVCVLALISLFFSSLTPSQGQVGAGITAAIATELAGRKISDIVNDFRQAGTALIDQATASGNALISRAANEANVLSRNVSLQLRDQLDRTFDDLDDQRKLLVVEAERIRRDLLSLRDDAYEIKDTTALDLNALVSKFPFVKESFFVQAIRGLAYLPQNSQFQLTVFATTLGIQEDVSTQLSLHIGHGDDLPVIDDIRVDQSQQRFVAKISIPNDALASSYKEKELSIVPLTLKFKVTKKEGWWIFSREKVVVYDVPIYLTLYPELAARAKVVAKIPKYDWVNVGPTEESYSTPNRHCSSNCRGEPTRGGNRIDLAVAGGPPPYKVGFRRLKSLDHRCVGGNCGFSDSFRSGLTGFNTKAFATWDTWSTSGTWRLKADVEEYQLIGETAHTSVTIPLYFNRSIAFLLPSGWTHAILEITTFTKNSYEVKVGEPDARGLVTYQGRSQAGPENERISYGVNEPSL